MQIGFPCSLIGSSSNSFLVFLTSLLSFPATTTTDFTLLQVSDRISIALDILSPFSLACLVPAFDIRTSSTKARGLMGKFFIFAQFSNGIASSAAFPTVRDVPLAATEVRKVRKELEDDPIKLHGKPICQV